MSLATESNRPIYATAAPRAIQAVPEPAAHQPNQRGYPAPRASGQASNHRMSPSNTFE